MKKIFCFMLFCLVSGFVFAQDEKESDKKASLSANVDLMSRYVWRGIDYGAAPSAQPGLTFKKGNFEMGAWGAYSLTGSYAEADLYASYTIKSITITAYDYFFPIESSPLINNNYFDYSNNSKHVFEGSLTYTGPEKFPLKLMAATLVYGNDKDPNDADKNNYSTYAEATYTVNCKDNSFDLFVGFTPKAGFFGNTMGVVNAGITASREIKINEKFALPVSCSVITNPQLENFHIVFGFSF